MSTFIYTAKRSLLQGHIADVQYEIEIGAVTAPKRRSVDKTTVRARGGATETLYYHADREWSITFEPVRGSKLDELIEFLDSTESGESFQMWIYGTESSPTTVLRSDDGYDLQEFMMLGAERSDWFQASIAVRAA